MAHLTDAERQTLNAASDIMMNLMTEGHYWSAIWNWTKGCQPCWTAYMFTPLLETQHSWLDGETFADKIENGLELIALEAASVPSAEEAKRLRIDALRKQLEALEAGA